MKNLELFKEFLTGCGYTNLRVETARACYILADKDGHTFCLSPNQIEKMMARE